MSAVIALLLANSVVHAQPTLSRRGDCGWVHGRFVFANGAGIRRIWVIGTKHYLNLLDADEDVPDRRFSMKNVWPGEVYYGDFYVCAREKFIPGHMQHVHLKAFRKLIVEKSPGN
jgi:hypothetical protein